MKALWVDQEDFLKIVAEDYERFPYANSWQLIYDRLFNRVMDNSKVLSATGMKQENLMKLYDGLKYEISRCPEDFVQSVKDHPVNFRMDQYLQKRGLV